MQQNNAHTRSSFFESAIKILLVEKRIILLFVLLIVLCSSRFSFAYTITRFDQTLCASSFPTAYVSGSFSIVESTAGEFGKNQSNKTIIINIPSGFSVNTTAGTYSVTGTSASDITSISISAVSANSITVKVTTANSTVDINTITVSCQLRATGAATGTIVRNGGNFKINRSTANPTAAQSLGNLSAAATMAFSSVTIAQPNITSAPQGTTDDDILQIQVQVTGTCNAFNLTQFNFNTTGSTNPTADISVAKVYYTGTTNSFATTTLFGSLNSPNGSFVITGTQALTAGTHYFWLSYSVPSNATVSNLLDAQCASITIDGGIGIKTPSSTSPAGSRTVSSLAQYYSRASGNWNDNTNWSSTDGGASCTCQPNGLGNVFINTNHTITLDATRATDYITIRNGATLKDNGTNALTVNYNLNTLQSGKLTATTAWTVNGNLILSGTGVSTTTKTLTVAVSTVIGSGTSLTENGGSGNDLTLKGNITVDGTLSSGTAGGTIILNGGSAQALSSTTTGTIAGTGALTMSTSAKSFAANSIFNIAQALAISGAITVTNNGTVNASGNITGTLSTSTWANASGSILKVAGTLLTTGTLTATAANTIEYNAGGDQTIKPTTYYNLTLSSSGTKTFSATTTTVTNMVTMSGSVIGDIGTNTLSGAGGLTMSGTTELKIAKTTTGSAVVPELTGVYNLTAGTITFNQTGAATQTLYGIAYYNVKLDGSNVSSNYDFTNVTGIQNNLDVVNKSNITTNGIFSVSGNLTHSTSGTSSLANDADVNGSSVFSNGTFNVNSKYFTSGDITLTSGVLNNTTSTIELTATGGWIKNGGTFTTTSGTVIFNGTADQALGGTQATTFVNLTITNTVSVTIAASTSISGTLTLTAGKIITGSNKVIITSTGAVSRTSGHIYGNEQRNVATGSNIARTFDIGGATNYSPVTLTFASVSVAGDVTASATASEHPQILSSLLSGSKSVNRYWTLSNSTTTFTNYTAVFTFVSSDLDASTNTSNLLVGNYTSAWIYPTTGTRTTTSTQSTGLTAFGDFALAECSSPSLVITNPSAVCASSTIDIMAASITSGSTSGLSLTYWTDVSATVALSSPAAVTSSGTYYIKGATAIGCYSIQPVTVTIYSVLAAGTVASDQSICYNATPSGLTNASSPSGGTGLYTYQWQTSSDNNAWSNISAATSATYAPSVLISTTYFRRAATSGSCGTVNTAAVAISVFADFTAGSIGSAQSICVGATPAGLTNTTLPTGGTGSYMYQWQSSANNSTWSNIILATSLTYSPGTAAASTYYRRSATSGSCGTSYTTSVLINADVNQTVSLSISSGAGTSICDGSSVTFTATPIYGGATPSYQWKVNGSNAGTSTNSFSTSALVNGDIVSCELASNYICIAGSNSAASNSLSMTVKAIGTWSGVDSDWDNTANWCGGVPTLTSDVIIPSGTAFSPQIASIAFVRNISINSGATLNMAGAGNLNVAGNFTNNNGTFEPASSTITFNGTGAQTIDGTVAAQTFNNMVVDKTSGTLTTGGSTTALTVNNFTVTKGDFTAPAVINVDGDFLLSAGSFTAGSNLNLKGNLTNNGATFVAGTNTVTMRGTSVQYISGTKANNFYNLIVTNAAANPGVSIQSNQNLVNVLTLSNDVTVDADGTSNTAILKLLSSGDNPTVDASVAKLPAGAQVTGKVTIQRYMAKEGASSGRIYRFISSPVQNGTVADIQNEISVTGSFTGTNTCSGCGTNQSMFSYNESVITDFNGNGVTDYNDGYVDFPDASNAEALLPGVGYSLFVRGNTLSTALWDIRGVINSGNVTPVTLPVSFTSSGTLGNDGYNLVGNPFPSTIDWNAGSGWTKTNLDAAIYINDNGYSPSRYATWNGVTGTNGGSRYIATGQAFWVKANGNGAPVLQADENVKTAGTQTAFFRAGSPADLLRITLVKGKLTDETVVHFRADASEDFDAHADAIKMQNATINLSSKMASGKNLAINSMPSLTCNVTIKLDVQNTKAGSYRLDFSEFDTFANDVSIILTDAFTGNTIDVRKKSSYAFSVTTKTESYGANRFSVTFKNAPLKADFALSTAANLCEGSSAQFQIKDSQSGATYVAFMDDKVVSSETMGNGGLISFIVPASNLTRGQNTFVVQSSLCGEKVEKNITIYSEKVYSVTAVGSARSCGDGVMILNASGAPKAGSYNWYENETSSQFITEQHDSTFQTALLSKSRVYYVSAVNALGCEGSRTAVEAEVIQLDPAKIIVNGNKLISSYPDGNQWYINNVLMEGATGQFIVPSETGTYRVEVLVSGCSTSASQEFIVTAIENVADSRLKLFPNPVSNYLSVEIPAVLEIEEATIIDELGVTLGSLLLMNDNEIQKGKFQMADLAAGVYILQLASKNGMTNIRIVKE
jgi:hypothetical protein